MLAAQIIAITFGFLSKIILHKMTFLDISATIVGATLPYLPYILNGSGAVSGGAIFAYFSKGSTKEERWMKWAGAITVSLYCSAWLHRKYFKAIDLDEYTTYFLVAVLGLTLLEGIHKAVRKFSNRIPQAADNEMDNRGFGGKKPKKQDNGEEN